MLIYNNKELYEIPDFPGYYATTNGSIYSVHTSKYIHKDCKDNKFHLLKCRLTRTGYARVYMRRQSTHRREDVYVHRIIATLFIPNPNHYPEVNHKDCNTLNNCVENLEWITHKENLEYGFLHGHKTRDVLGRFTYRE